jgi:hypothetical protein
VFHQVRPTNTAILHAYIQFARLRAALPRTEVVMVAGNHDTPRAAETGCILRLFIPLGIHVVEAEPRALEFPELDLSVLAIADNQHARPKLVPSGTRRWNVLMLHGEVEGMLGPFAATHELATEEISQEELNASHWDYIALGHYHVYRRMSPNQFYSGSLDYTSTNSWGERIEEEMAGVPGKGIIEHDLTTGGTPSTAPAVARVRRSADGVARGLTDRGGERAALLPWSTSCPGGIDDKVVPAGDPRSAAAHHATARPQAAAASSAVARCTSISTRAGPRSSARSGTARRAASVARRLRARQAARAHGARMTWIATHS